MKRVTLLFFLLAAISAKAQIDTIDNYFLRATNIVTPPAPVGGYAFGMGYDDVGAPFDTILMTECVGNYYDSIGIALVSEVLIWFTDVQFVGGPDELNVRVYEAKADSMPQWPLLARTYFDLDDVTLNGWTAISVLEDSGQISEDFFVALYYNADGIDDTFGIASNDPAFNDGMGEKRTRVRLDGVGVWVRAFDLYNGLDADVMIIPVVDFTVGSNELQLPGLHLSAPYPNPATEEVTLSYELDKAQDIRITGFGLDGKLFYDSGTIAGTPGANQLILDVSDLPAGNYYYSVFTSGKRLTSKIAVVR